MRSQQREEEAVAGVLATRAGGAGQLAGEAGRRGQNGGEGRRETGGGRYSVSAERRGRR